MDIAFRRKYEGTEIQFKSISDLQRDYDDDVIRWRRPKMETCKLIKLYMELLKSHDRITQLVSAKY